MTAVLLFGLATTVLGAVCTVSLLALRSALRNTPPEEVPECVRRRVEWWRVRLVPALWLSSTLLVIGVLALARA
ncbi:hypothetical protein GCM10010174_57800 [Kutzneria viridogrisea]|uniref:Uncharacterized protein n=1 Tax=Kutzneria viridogrisea TaxID=47990 RepID=A0ABR6BKH4_9PSEU|nr:hypothetical protein [Kutzneria viridogrisea]